MAKLNFLVQGFKRKRKSSTKNVKVTMNSKTCTEMYTNKMYNIFLNKMGAK